MAHTITGASLAPIYERLNGVADYHPMDAETFADWSMEAGDIVTVTRDGKEYSSPVHSTTMTWRGRAPVVTINTTGNQKREPVSKVSRRKYGSGGAGMRNDQELVSDLWSEDGQLHSLIVQTTTYIMTAVEDTASDLHSQIVQTAGMIQTTVDAASSSLYTVIQQTATGIYSGVYNDLSGDFATIVMTSTMIATSVTSASSTLYSTIQQTSTSIMSEVGKKNRVFVQFTDPALTVPDLHDGDIWVKSNSTRTWNQLFANIGKWNSVGDYQWRNMYGSQWYVRKNGVWEPNVDEAAIIEQKVRVEHDDEHYAILAHEIDTLGNRTSAKFQVTARKIESEVASAHEDSISRITQTATEIRSEVSTSNSTIWSSITQTSTEISLKVGKGEVISSINQTAEAITINANRINLNGYVKATDLTATYLSAQLANFASLTSERGGISVYSIGTTSYTQGGVSCYVPSAIRDVRISGPVDNVYTLQRKRFNDSDWVDCESFSRATSLSGSWSGGTLTVTATPQNETYTYSNQWSYGTITSNNSAPSSYAKKYDVDTSKRYWYFNVTVNGQAKRILLDVLGI